MYNIDNLVRAQSKYLLFLLCPLLRITYTNLMCFMVYVDNLSIKKLDLYN